MMTGVAMGASTKNEGDTRWGSQNQGVRVGAGRCLLDILEGQEFSGVNKMNKDNLHFLLCSNAVFFLHY